MSSRRNEPVAVGTWNFVGDVTVSEHHWRHWRVLLATETGTTTLAGLLVLPASPVEWGQPQGDELVDDDGQDQGRAPTEMVESLAHQVNDLGRDGESPSALSAVELRALPLREMMAQRSEPDLDTPALERVRQWPRVLWDDVLAEQLGVGSADVRAIEYLRDAYLFADAVQNGYSRPVMRVARQLEHTSRQTTAGRLTAARRHGLLTKPTRGKATGELTSKARQLVKMMDRLAALRPTQQDLRRTDAQNSE